MKQPSHGGNLAWAASLAGCSPFDILDFSASISPLGPPASAIAAIQAHLGALRAYPDPNYSELRAAIAQHHGVPSDWVCPGNGSAELLTWVSRDLAALSATCLITPAFGDYGRSLKAFGATVVASPMPLSDVLMDQAQPLPSLADLLIQTAHPPDLSTCGVLINNPHNPTGHLFSASGIVSLLPMAALVVVDEAFMDFLPPDQQQSVMDAVATHPNLVVLRSLTKFYSLPGLRIGYAIAHPSHIQRWQQWRDPWSVNTLAAAATVAVLDDTDFQQATWDWLPAARSHLFEGLRQIPGLQPLPSAANYILVGSQHSTVELQRALLQRFQILIRDCVSFPELGDRYFRVAVRTRAENQRLLNGLAAVL